MKAKELEWQEARDCDGVMAITPIGEFHVFDLTEDGSIWIAELWHGPEEMPNTIDANAPDEMSAKAACAAFWHMFVGKCISA